MAFQLYTEITINASKETIWKILTQTDSFPDWNPFIRKMIGTFEVGNVIEVHLQPADSKPMTFKPKVLEVNEKCNIKWLGSFLVKGIFDGEHHFEIEELSENLCKFKHFEHFQGILVPFLKSSLDKNTKQGFIAMNEALKKLAENSFNAH